MSVDNVASSAPNAAGREPRVALLVGNRNVGKSAIFWRLTGRPSEACNVPGRPVAHSAAPVQTGARVHWRRLRRAMSSQNRGDGVEGVRETLLVDLPGAGSVFALGEDEMAVRDLLLEKPDLVVFVADAKNMRRSLALFQQVAAFGYPMVFDINMMDEAETLGIHIDVPALSRRLGCPCVASVAVEGHGMRRLLRAFDKARPATSTWTLPSPVASALDELTALLRGSTLSPRALGMLLLARDERAFELVAEDFGPGTRRAVLTIVERLEALHGGPLDVWMTEHFHAVADTLAWGVVGQRKRSTALSERLGLLVQSPVTGLPIALLIILAMYFWVGWLGSGVVVDLIETRLFERWLIPLVERGVEPIPWPFVRGALVDPDFGLVPTGLFLAVGIVLPVLFFFFLFFAVLEDSGYLPRLSILLDKVLRLLGLNGKGVLPLVMGFSCVTMAIITTRMLDTKKERLIATFLLVLGIPCAPLLSVQILILKDMSWTAPVTVYGLILAQIVVAGVLANRIVGGRLPDFILEIPRLRAPKPSVVLARTWRRSMQFMREAVPVFLFASFLMYVLDWFGGLSVIEGAVRPVVGHLLGMPDKAVQVLIKTIIRRESGAAELHLVRGAFDSVQIVVTLLVMTFLVPCLNTVIVMVKEHGVKSALAIIGSVMVYCVLVGSLVNAVCRAFGVSFA